MMERDLASVLILPDTYLKKKANAGIHVQGKRGNVGKRLGV